MKAKSLAIGATAFVMSVAVPATTFAGYFPADRTTYTCVNTNQCEGADHIVFNSFTNNPVVGDERPFFAGSLNGAAVQDRIKVKDGDVVVLRSYVHNNADPNKTGVANSVARNVKMKVLLPKVSKSDQNLVSFVSADNANPGTINDTMSLYGDNNFTVSYVPGTTFFDHKMDGKNMNSDKLSDNIVNGGASLGDIFGCFQYSGYVTMKVKVSMPTPPKPVTPVTPVTPTTPTPVTPTAPTTPAPAPVTPAVAPTTLVNTGAGSVIGMFAAVATAGTVAYRWMLGRRLSNQ